MGDRRHPRLTPTQWLVLERLAAGEANAMIAAELGLAPKAVRNHLTRFARQLPRDPALTRRAAAVAWYLTVGRALREQEARRDE